LGKRRCQSLSLLRTKDAGQGRADDGFGVTGQAQEVITKRDREVWGPATGLGMVPQVL